MQKLQVLTLAWLGLPALLGMAQGGPAPVEAYNTHSIYMGEKRGIVNQGIAKYYDDGIMEAVRRNRTNPGHRAYIPGLRILKGVHGWASTTDCSLIGQVVHASFNGGAWERFQAIDCSHPAHRKGHIARGIIIEVDYDTAARHVFVNRDCGTLYYQHGCAKAKTWIPITR